jgi:hypothetical protein
VTRKRPAPKPSPVKSNWRELVRATSWHDGDHLRQTATNANPKSVVVMRYEAGIYKILIREDK